MRTRILSSLTICLSWYHPPLMRTFFTITLICLPVLSSCGGPASPVSQIEVRPDTCSSPKATSALHRAQDFATLAKGGLRALEATEVPKEADEIASYNVTVSDVEGNRDAALAECAQVEAFL